MTTFAILMVALAICFLGIEVRNKGAEIIKELQYIRDDMEHKPYYKPNIQCVPCHPTQPECGDCEYALSSFTDAEQKMYWDAIHAKSQSMGINVNDLV